MQMTNNSNGATHGIKRHATQQGGEPCTKRAKTSSSNEVTAKPTTKNLLTGIDGHVVQIVFEHLSQWEYVSNVTRSCKDMGRLLDKNEAVCTVSRHAVALQTDTREALITMHSTNTSWYRMVKEKPSLSLNKAVILAAVKRNASGGCALKYAANTLKEDIGFVLQVIAADHVNRRLGTALYYSRLRGNKEVVLAAVKRCGVALKYSHKKLKRDKTIVMAAVQHNGCALQYAHESLKSNEAVVMAAVQHSGCALQYAHESLKSNEAIVMAAVQHSGCALSTHMNLSKATKTLSWQPYSTVGVHWSTHMNLAKAMKPLSWQLCSRMGMHCTMHMNLSKATNALSWRLYNRMGMHCTMHMNLSSATKALPSQPGSLKNNLR